MNCFLCIYYTGISETCEKKFYRILFDVMSNYLDAAIATALGAGDRFLIIFGLDKDYLTGGYDQLRSFLGPHVQYPLGLIGLDVDYLVWLLCVLAPIIFAFVLPLITVTVFYLCICVINFVKFKHHFYQVMFDVLFFRMKQEKVC